ncbi:MAG: DUF5320 domain-containing protein [Bacteroidales bacterium]|nr:DUF5320 domain-containing protein [Bacteroidales bacterium]
MPKLDGTGPDGKGSRTGRKLGKCNNLPEEEKLNKMGKGMGQRRNTGGGQGKGNRGNSGKV